MSGPEKKVDGLVPGYWCLEVQLREILGIYNGGICKYWLDATSCLPFPALGTMAWFSLKKGYFHIIRAAIDLPQVLQFRLFSLVVHNSVDREY